MTRKPKPLAAAELEVWARYLRGVRPLTGARVPEVAEVVEAPAPAPKPVEAVPPKARMAATSHRSAAIAIGTAPAGLDRATWTRFRTGRIAPERTLDLHGMTAANAHSAVTALMAGAISQGLRCVEIVTGHGRRTGGEGVLRREVPFWLNDAPLRGMILAVCHPHAANQGSLLVLLRRVRP